MVPWELGKVSTSFLTGEERSLVGRRSPGGCPFWSGISRPPQVLMKATFLYSTFHPSQGKLSCFSGLSYNHNGENSSSVEKLDLRNKKIHAGLFGGSGGSAYASLWPSSSHVGNDPLAEERFLL